MEVMGLSSKMNPKKTKDDMRKSLQEALKRADAKEAQFVANTSHAANLRKSVRPEELSGT